MSLDLELVHDDRFVLQRRLGAGGMGVVYLAHDRERDALVALKTLTRLDGQGLTRLKQEFRALADVTHPNLVALHELIVDGAQGFFTMEHVEGVPFTDHVRLLAVGAGPQETTRLLSARATLTAGRHDLPSAPTSAGELPESAPPEDAAPEVRVASAGFDLDRLRPALRQLAAGISAIHAAGKLHRDLKPSNVLVTRAGRVVILDFGLVVGHGARRPGPGVRPSGEAPPSDPRQMMGTPAYMAPEQAIGEGLPASDWYAFGVMLFQALTGSLPFEGDAWQIVRQKHASDPPHCSTLVPGLPEDLAELCMACLRRAPDERPLGAEILLCLGVDSHDVDAPPVDAADGATPVSLASVSLGSSGEAALPGGDRVSAVPVSSRQGSASRSSPNTPSSRRFSSVGLLSPASSRTPRGASIPPPSTTRAPPSYVPFIGREALLGALDGAFSAVRAGQPRTVHLRGRSGMGKSALVEHFLDRLAAEPGTVVLSGRCYERESVPYKAWDSLVEALGRHLASLPVEQLVRLLPRETGALARIFPSLRLVGAIELAAQGEEGEGVARADALETRRRAFGALRELLSAVAARGPLVLHVDDLQWGCVDSARLMASVLAPPDAPPLMLLASYRSEEAEGSAFFRELHAHGGDAASRGDAVPFVTLEVERLSEEESVRLVRSLLEVDAPFVDGLAAAIAREAEGSPFYLAELVRSVLESGVGDGGQPAAPDADALAGVSLESVLQTRVRRLPEDARRLLEVLSVAARPLEQGLAAAAAQLGSDDRLALGVLRGAHLVRTRGARTRDLAEPYHDRVREAVVRGLSEGERRACHERLAGLLEASGRADPEELAAHYDGAGRFVEAGHFAELAAERAAAALAFHRAARLYRRALGCRELAAREGKPPPGGAAGTRALQVKLGHALVAAGLGAEAAPLFLEAARELSPADALELRRLAAEQLLMSGHFDQGIDELRAVLASVGERYPETSVGAILALAAEVARLRLRGVRFTERPPAAIPAADLVRLDILYSAGKGLTLVDPVRGFGFHARYLRLALQAGEPGRVCLGLAFQGVNTSLAGAGAYPRARRLLDEAGRLADSLGDPYHQGVVRTLEGAASMCLGHWKRTLEQVAEGAAILRAGCRGVEWELEGGIVCAEVSMLWMGRLRELTAFVRTHAGEAHDRGDLFAATYARMHTWYAPIAAGDPARAGEEMREAIGRWSQGGFHIMHFWALYGQTQVDLYAGDAAAARARLRGEWAALRASNILRVQFHRVFMTLLLGTTAVAAASARPAGERRRLLREASRVADELAAERTAYATPCAALVRAGVLGASGRGERAVEELERAMAGFEAADMALHAACARRRKGELVGGEVGRALVGEADAAMREQRIVDPARWTRMQVPGFERP